MAEVPLRSYLHEIENHIESGRTDQAIAHSKYILQNYPKCVDAYRLLGKSYLEGQRYTDAGDIFQRVISSVPGDFVSHVGMSIIREDEGNLDEAIWHMERAFEVQPSNGAIQEELRRLYEKRDKFAPPKIRLTRGALARLYAKGELYPQAIGEIRAALGENADRLDLQALLAEIYLKLGQRVEAADTALAVLRHLPNCIAANRVMAQVLVGADREMELKSYRQRLAQLDPYTAYASLNDLDSEAVPDQAVRVEKLEWKPDQGASTVGQPAWAASLGVDLGDLAPSEAETLPDWLDEETSPTTAKAAPAEPPPADLTEEEEDIFADIDLPSAEPPGEEDVPDWLREAGWVPSSGAGEAGNQGEARLDFETGEGIVENEERIAKAEIPDWLKAMAPPEETANTPASDEDVTPWLDNLIPKEQEAEAANDAETARTPQEREGLPDWLMAAGVAGGAAAAGPGAEETGIEPPETVIPGAAEEERPAASLEESRAQPKAAPEIQPEPVEAETPGWMVEAEPAEEDEGFPEWLREANLTDITEAAGKEPEEAQGEEAEPPNWMAEIGREEGESGLPDWLVEAELPGEEPRPIEAEAELQDRPSGTSGPEIEGQPETTEAEVPEWLEETQPPEEESQASEEAAEGAEELPDWLQAMQNASSFSESEGEEASEAEISGEELPDWLMQETPSASEEQPEGAEAELPDWLIEADLSGGAVEAAIEEEAALVEETPVEEGTAGQEEGLEAIPDWLLDAEPPEEEPEKEPAEEAELPDWLVEAGIAGGEVKAAVAKEAVPAKETPAEEEMAEPEEGLEEIPDWLLEAEPSEEEPEKEPAEEAELPDWLAEVEETPAGEEKAGPAGREMSEAGLEIPDWLQGVDQLTEETFEPEASEEEFEEAQPATELPDWLLEMQEGEAEETTKAGALLLGDTQPTRVAQPPEAPEPPAEAAEVEVMEETPAAEAAEQEVPDELQEAFAWLMGLQTTPEIQPPPENLPETQARVEQPEEELFLEEMRKTGEAGEAVEPLAEESSLMAWPETPAQVEAEAEAAAVEAPAAPGVSTGTGEDLVDDDAAFAWLESLAVKQGADEALLLKPEERLESMPEWVRQEALAAEEEAQAAPPEAAEEEAAEAEAETAVAEINDQEALVEEALVEEAPVEEAPAEETPAAEPFEAPQAEMVEEAPAELPAEAAPVEPEEAPAAALEETAAVPPTEAADLEAPEAAEEVPELPDWLTETAVAAREELEWSPPAFPVVRFDLNEASLSELERLPGIGFITAQNIVAYRDEHGPFGAVDELNNVPGVSATTLEEARSLLFVKEPEPEEPQELAEEEPVYPSEADEVTPELSEARAALSQGKLKLAMQQYAELIRGQRNLKLVIRDLEEASYRFPNEINVWQNLGDVYLRLDQVQQALKAYITAEQLLG